MFIVYVELSSMAFAKDDECVVGVFTTRELAESVANEYKHVFTQGTLTAVLTTRIEEIQVDVNLYPFNPKHLTAKGSMS